MLAYVCEDRQAFIVTHIRYVGEREGLVWLDGWIDKSPHPRVGATS